MSGTRVLAVGAVADSDFPVFRAAAAAATVLLELPVPARWTWTVLAGGGRPPRAWLEVESIDAECAAAAAAAVEAALRATVPGVVWAADQTGGDENDEVVGTLADVVLGAVGAPDLDPDVPHGPDLLLPFWQGVHAGAERVALVLRFRAPSCGGTGPVGSISLAAPGPTVLAYAMVVAAALSRHPGELVAAARRADAQPLALSAARVGRCLSAVMLLREEWPSMLLVSPDDVVEHLTTCAPPHTVLFGGSGSGKTTLLEAMVERRLATGRAILVIDPHGDLSARATVSAAALGTRITCVDFGDIRQPPHWNVTRPPAGTDPRAWSVELLDAIQAGWPDADQQWFGPVFRRSMAALLLPLVLDPAGPWPLTRLEDMAVPAERRTPTRPGVADPTPAEGAAAWRRRVLARIDDPAVTRDVEEAVRMMDGDRDGHARTWLLSKLEPLVRHPGMHEVLGSTDIDIDVDAIASGASLIVSTSAAALGEQGATVLSMLVLRRVWGLLRAGRAPEGGVEVVLDEAHRMPAALCSEMLAEGRKHGLQLRLATQSPALLEPQLRTAVLTNAGTVATMRLGLEDSAHVRSRFRGMTLEELGTLPPHRVAIAMASGATVLGSGPPGRSVGAGRAPLTATPPPGPASDPHLTSNATAG
ncbi:type IV secretory system conjugative DNA transfer family protein [uncultured Pseudonocardia sp.]|uniref:type IV secretory system conjugative DNA transfer family protein n=1 Tax=uncultured Pseudonocardia sp. TaxID=211455 RepID=UPI00262A788A|nr:DUF87 domain-containing protein [uncultured Pseudonocardia sp.]